MSAKPISGKSRRDSALETKPARMKSEICSGGKVTVKPGQSRYEAQQEALKKSDKPAATDTATTEEVGHVSKS